MLHKHLPCVLFQGQAIDSEHISEMTEEEMEVSFMQARIRGFAWWDYKYFIPFFTRRFTQQVTVSLHIPKNINY